MADVATRDLTPEFGTEVSGFDPKMPLERDTADNLQDLFDRRGVLLFRDHAYPSVHRRTSRSPRSTSPHRQRHG
jgi:alpha-ketoglutarate-dependent taurine dioxygenase